MDKTKHPWDKTLGVIARGWGLKPALVRAIVQVESSGNPKAVRYEPAFYERYIKNRGFSLMEGKALATSWGLMQIMGMAAKEIGYTYNHFGFLLMPEIGIFWGCRKLAEISIKYQDEQEVIATYNAGSALRKVDGTFINQEYVDKVTKEMATYLCREK